MKVQIKQLEPNPYRDMNNYPMDEVKVRNLVDSIQQTGFWDNILARKKNGKYQIAYGHHRLAAIREVFKPMDEVDIPVKDLDDATMIKIMANENMDDWKTTPRVIDETVRVTKQFLEEHPEEMKKLGQVKLGSVGADFICRFLNWKEYRVNYSLERLHMIKDDRIDKEAIDQLPTERSARDFVKAIKSTPLPRKEQKKVINDIIKTQNFGESAINKAVLEAKWKPLPKEEKKKEADLKTLDDVVKEAHLFSNSLTDRLKILQRLKNDLGGDLVYSKLDAAMLTVSLKRLYETLTNLLNNIENEN